jgi:hypothetical protein
MVIDEDLLRQAQESGVRLADAQRTVDLAKADYHHAVRRLHFTGASMREIADALDVSHQRVHQIIEATGGTGGWKHAKAPTGDLACSFCGLPRLEVRKLISGPGVFICADCVGLVHQVSMKSPTVVTTRSRFDLLPAASQLECSFCGKANEGMVSGPGVRVCGTCIDLCDEVLAAADH